MTDEKMKQLAGAWIRENPTLLRIVRYAAKARHFAVSGNGEDIDTLQKQGLVEDRNFPDIEGGRLYVLTPEGAEFAEFLGALSPDARVAYFARRTQ